MDGMLTIGWLAKAAQMPTDTIRYYESVGLLPPPARSDAGYRLYPRSEIRRLQLIKRGKVLGLSLAEIKRLVDQSFSGSCVHLQRALLARIPAQLAALDQRVTELHALRTQLLAMQEHLRGLDGTLRDDPLVECEDCPCLAGEERR
jgi:MerR family copper efflux transcriptional regulator